MEFKFEPEEGDKKKSTKRIWRGPHGMKVEIYTGGDKAEKKQAKKDILPEAEKVVNKILKGYDGGGLIIIKNEYDEDMRPSNTQYAQLGVDDPAGLMAQAMAMIHGAQHILEILAETIGEKELEKMLGQISDDSDSVVVKMVKKEGGKSAKQSAKGGRPPFFTSDDEEGQDIDDLRSVLDKLQ